MATQIEEIKNYFKDLYKRSLVFIKNNKIELGTLFVVLFLLFTIDETNKYCITKQNGGLPSNPQAQQQAQQQAQKQAQQQAQQLKQIQQKALEEQKKKRELTDRTKMEIASSFSNKFMNLAQNNKTLNNIICYISSFFKSSIALFSIVFAVMLIPGIPVFGFMLLLFAILRTKVSNIKAL
jgi:hypothetical protein